MPGIVKIKQLETPRSSAPEATPGPGRDDAESTGTGTPGQGAIDLNTPEATDPYSTELGANQDLAGVGTQFEP